MRMNPESVFSLPRSQRGLSRRELLRRTGSGLGTLGLTALLAEQELLGSAAASAEHRTAASSPLAPKPPHFPARAKRVIHLLMNGGPSHIDTFDHKPELAKYVGQRPAVVDLRTQRKTEGLMPSPFQFARHGESGLWVSELFPHVARHIDDLCVINSMYTDIPEHVSGLLMMNIGANQPTRPSLGAWLTYGLGTENQNLPGFVVLCHRGKHRPGRAGWSSSFLSSVYSGSFVDTYQLQPQNVIRDIRNRYLSRTQQRRQLDLLQQINRQQLQRIEQDRELEARIESLELAFRMQFAAPEAFEISQESKATFDLYGIGSEPTSRISGGRAFGGFAEGCLIARRLSERGVRIVQLAFAPDIAWDDHTDIRDHRPKAFDCDRAIAALLQDLKSRGLLDETLVIWGGEFGRTPTSDPTANKPGRDHNHYGFTVWLAGGGVKGGLRYGATDEFGMKAVENRMHVHDLHATILHMMGLDHERLTYRYSGRDFRLTDVSGQVAHEIVS